jgi:hypothetical protein
MVDPSIEILNQLASNSSKAESLQNEIAHILNGLHRADPQEVSGESENRSLAKYLSHIGEYRLKGPL